MKILSIPTLAHDASICILENGIITFYKMEERYSRVKHDLSFDNILEFHRKNKEQNKKSFL